MVNFNGLIITPSEFQCSNMDLFLAFGALPSKLPILAVHTWAPTAYAESPSLSASSCRALSKGRRVWFSLLL